MSDEEQPIDELFLEGMQRALNLDGFWRNGYDLTDREIVIELMTLMQDFDVYRQHKAAFMKDLLKAGWGYLKINITVPDLRPIRGPDKRNKSGYRKETVIRKLNDTRAFLKQLQAKGGMVDDIELNTDRITQLEQYSHHKSRRNYVKWMREHPGVTHSVKTHIS